MTRVKHLNPVKMPGVTRHRPNPTRTYRLHQPGGALTLLILRDA